MATDIYTRYQWWFSRGKSFMLTGSFLALIGINFCFVSLFYFHSKTGAVFSLLAANFGLFLSLEGYTFLRKVYVLFVNHSKIRTVAITTHRETGIQVLVPRFSVFLMSKNLRDFETKFLNDRAQFRKLYSEWKRKAQAVAEQEETVRRSEELKAQFLSALSAVTSEKELRGYLRKYDCAPGFAAKRILIDELVRKGAAQSEVQGQLTNKLNAFRKHLETITGDKLCDSARQAVEEYSLAPDLKLKIVHIKKAITEQKKANRARDREPISSTIPDKQIAQTEQKFATLADRINTDYDLSLLLPDSVDKTMTAQILISLIDPGKSVHLFGANYRPYDSLKRDVVSSYTSRSKQPFAGKSFDASLKWLTKQKILITKPKTDEPVYSLNPKPNQGASNLARTIIQKTIEFERGIRG